MKRAFPWDEQLDMSSESDEPSSSDSEMETSNGCDANKPLSEIAKSLHARAKMSEELLIRRAKMYQEYMKQIQVPIRRGSVIPCNSWMELGRSLKQLYDQPLHYLTNTFLKQWDQLRIGTGDEHKPLDNIIHPCKAETIIWLMEEVHRKTSSHLYLAQLWKADPMHQAFVDSVFPSLEHLY